MWSSATFFTEIIDKFIATFLTFVFTTSKCTNLRSQIGDGNEFLEQVLWQDVGVAALLDVVRANVDVVRTQM